MPIHDQGYRHYAGERALHRRAWWVIARAGIMERLRERRFLGLLLFSWSLFLMRAVQLYLGTTIAQASFLAPTEQTFHQFLNQQRIFVFFITIYAGAGLIANDRQSNALQIYLSKPITRHEYIAGKLFTLAAFLVAVTWLPAMLLLVLQVLFSGGVEFVSSHPRLIPAITLASFLQVSLAVMTMVALVVVVAQPPLRVDAVRGNRVLRRRARRRPSHLDGQSGVGVGVAAEHTCRRDRCHFRQRG